MYIDTIQYNISFNFCYNFDSYYYYDITTTMPLNANNQNHLHLLKPGIIMQ